MPNPEAGTALPPCITRTLALHASCLLCLRPQPCPSLFQRTALILLWLILSATVPGPFLKLTFNASQLCYRFSNYRGYSTGYDDDPSASLRDGWNNLVERWQRWPAEERNPTLAYGAGEAPAVSVCCSG